MAHVESESIRECACPSNDILTLSGAGGEKVCANGDRRNEGEGRSARSYQQLGYSQMRAAVVVCGGTASSTRRFDPRTREREQLQA